MGVKLLKELSILPSSNNQTTPSTCNFPQHPKNHSIFQHKQPFPHVIHYKVWYFIQINPLPHAIIFYIQLSIKCLIYKTNPSKCNRMQGCTIPRAKKKKSQVGTYFQSIIQNYTFKVEIVQGRGCYNCHSKQWAWILL